MKQLYNLLIFTLLSILFLGSCTEDLGNYDYHDLNNVTISSLPSDTTVKVLENFVLTPELSRDLENIEDDLEFVWRIDAADTISTERNLDYIIPTSISFGAHTCHLIVRDKNTGVRYFSRFNLNISGTFGLGYYILSEKEDQSSLISYLRTDYNDDTEWIFTNSVGYVTLGNKPRLMTAKRKSYWKEYKAYGMQFNILTQEGEYNMIETESFTFTPTALCGKSMFLGGDSSTSFSPENMIPASRGFFFLTENKFAVFKAGLIYPPADFPEPREWSAVGLWGSDELWGYDEISGKLYLIKCTPGENSNEINYTEEITFGDNEIENAPLLLSIGGSWGPDYGSRIYTYDLVYSDGNSIVFLQKTVSEIWEDWVPTGDITTTIKDKIALPISGLDENTKCLKSGQNIYFIIGNKIYSSPILNPQLTELIEIPAEYGKPVALEMTQPATDPQRLWVASYNPESSKELKGSVFVLNPVDGSVDNIFPNVCGKAVSVVTAETSER